MATSDTILTQAVVERKVRPARGRLPLEVLIIIFDKCLRRAPAGEVVRLLLVNHCLTKSLYLYLYRYVRVQTFNALRSLCWALRRLPELAAYMRKLEFVFPDMYPYGTTVAVRSRIVQSKADVAAWQVEIIKNAAPYLRHLIVRAYHIHPTVFYCIRTTDFPSVNFLDGPYSLVLDNPSTVKVYIDICSNFLGRGGNLRDPFSLGLSDVAPSWRNLVRLWIHIDEEEVVTDSPWTNFLASLPALRQISMSFQPDAVIHYIDYLEQFVVPDWIEGFVVIMHYYWAANSPTFAPFPPPSMSCHPRMLFASQSRPYFFADYFPAVETVEHLKPIVMVYETATSWTELWEDALNTFQINEKDGLVGTSLQSTALQRIQ
ncbi:hypothetical protein VNI00_010351 [Paramarasmius palmivorus]|uniref:F-box domain-containing protein n=1 Tax=Paramarasmius palmivorus TaxID=297713 RepID=A0AAW0CKY4_9AGAR